MRGYIDKYINQDKLDQQAASGMIIMQEVIVNISAPSMREHTNLYWLVVGAIVSRYKGKIFYRPCRLIIDKE